MKDIDLDLSSVYLFALLNPSHQHSFSSFSISGILRKRRKISKMFFFSFSLTLSSHRELEQNSDELPNVTRFRLKSRILLLFGSCHWRRKTWLLSKDKRCQTLQWDAQEFSVVEPSRMISLFPREMFEPFPRRHALRSISFPTPCPNFPRLLLNST